MDDRTDYTPYTPPRRKKTWMLGLIIPLVAILPLWFFMWGPQMRRNSLLNHGIHVPGRLLDVEETGNQVNNSPELKLTLEFTRRDGRRDTATTDFVPSLRSLSMFQPGVGATVAYDSADPHEVTIVDLSTPNFGPADGGPAGANPTSNANVDSLRRVIDSLSREVKKSM